MHAIRWPIAVVLALWLAAFGAQAQPRNFQTHLTGAEEVPPNVSAAQGQVTFQVAADGLSIRFRLNIANIRDVTMAHIHNAPFGANGPVVAWLYPAAPPPQLIEGRTDGVLSAGVITAANLTGSLAGQPLQALIDLIAAGNTYVNVHTSAFPPGEVRGQIR
jgi:hypothetical protein